MNYHQQKNMPPVWAFTIMNPARQKTIPVGQINALLDLWAWVFLKKNDA